MALTILNNITAIAAENQLNITSNSLNSTLEQLSSGSRINSGADDPAGLAIANGLSANIATLTQSSSNATDGVGELQVADGALSQVTTLLDRAIARFEREQKSMGSNVTVFKNYSPDVPLVRFDAELMERVVSNLLVNAAQASPPGGVVTVKTLSDQAEVEISVIDRGSGIDPKDIENIFNPFFTTKSQGVGFGLAIVSKIVEEHGGRITVESTPGEGSIFRVFLPAAA